MKNPFERFMQSQQLSPEKAEQAVRQVMARKLDMIRVNGPGMRSAYQAAKELNEQKKLGLTRNHLLNMLREEARAAAAFSESNDDLIYRESGGTVEGLIDSEVERIRAEERDIPQ